MGKEPAKVCQTCGREFYTEDDFLRDTSRWRICDRGNLWFNCTCQSTNMIVKGNFDWYSPDRFMSRDAGRLFNTLPGLKDLPHLPYSVMELQQLIRDENVNAAKLAKASRQDPIIAANILKIANNLKTGRGMRIDSLEHAISYIGLNALSDIILTASVSSFPFKTKIFRSEDFWENSLLCGRVAEALARRYAKGLVPDEVYIAGALCNIGKVAMAICSPNHADRIVRDLADPKNPATWGQAERRNEAHDHSVLGEIAATFWGLPDYVMDGAIGHHRLPAGNADDQEMRLIVILANQLTHWLQLNPAMIDQKLMETSGSMLGLSTSDLDKLVEELMPLVREEEKAS